MTRPELHRLLVRTLYLIETGELNDDRNPDHLRFNAPDRESLIKILEAARDHLDPLDTNA